MSHSLCFFESSEDKDRVLLFCSENHTDFAVELKVGGDKGRRFAIDSEIAEALPKTHYFLQLSDLVAVADRGYESLPNPPEYEEAMQATARHQELEAQGLTDTAEYRAALWQDMAGDIPDEGIEAQNQAEEFREKMLMQKFLDEVKPQLPVAIRQCRDDACNHIEEMLKKCRECSSWDDRSELKLPQWLEYVPEHMIRYTILPNILRIEVNVERYLRIHQDMENDQKSK